MAGLIKNKTNNYKNAILIFENLVTFSVEEDVKKSIDLFLFENNIQITFCCLVKESVPGLIKIYISFTENLSIRYNNRLSKFSLKIENVLIIPLEVLYVPKKIFFKELIQGLSDKKNFFFFLVK